MIRQASTTAPPVVVVAEAVPLLLQPRFLAQMMQLLKPLRPRGRKRRAI
jgi:hypothetical protein